MSALSGIFKFLLLIFLVSCGSDSGEVKTVNNAHEIDNISAELKWKKEKFPITIEVPIASSQYKPEWQSSLESAIDTWNFGLKDHVDLGGKEVFEIIYTKKNDQGVEEDIDNSIETKEEYEDKVNVDSLMSVILPQEWVLDETNILAITSFTYRKSTNFLIEADIIFNVDTYFNDFQVLTDTCNSRGCHIDFETVLVHELGHFLGFDHVDKDEDSVMKPEIRRGEINRELTSRDIERIVQKYE